MKLSEFKTYLKQVESVKFVLSDGKIVPQHYHVTEVAQVNKRFIDCGGVIRDQASISLQLWTSDDYDHRLSCEKLNAIISLAQEQLNLEDLDLVVQYQGNTIEEYDLSFNGSDFVLERRFTDCLAKDSCKPIIKSKVNLASFGKNSCCPPESNCC